MAEIRLAFYQKQPNKHTFGAKFPFNNHSESKPAMTPKRHQSPTHRWVRGLGCVGVWRNKGRYDPMRRSGFGRGCGFGDRGCQLPEDREPLSRDLWDLWRSLRLGTSLTLIRKLAAAVQRGILTFCTAKSVSLKIVEFPGGEKRYDPRPTRRVQRIKPNYQMRPTDRDAGGEGGSDTMREKIR